MNQWSSNKKQMPSPFNENVLKEKWTSSELSTPLQGCRPLQYNKNFFLKGKNLQYHLKQGHSFGIILRFSRNDKFNLLFNCPRLPHVLRIKGDVLSNLQNKKWVVVERYSCDSVFTSKTTGGLTCDKELIKSLVCVGFYKYWMLDIIRIFF